MNDVIRALFYCALLIAPAVNAEQRHFVNSAGHIALAWLNGNEELQQLDYELAPSKLPPLIAYRATRMAEDVMSQLLTQGKARYPQVQFTLTRPSFELQLTGYNQDKIRAAAAWLESNRPQQEQAWLEEHYFQRVRLHTGEWAIKQDHVRIAMASRAELAPLALLLKQQGKSDMETRQKTILHILEFIQSIPYASLDKGAGEGGGFLTPGQVLAQNRGDCDSKVTLMASLVAQLFPDLQQVIVFIPQHALLGIALPAADPGAMAITSQGEHYLLMEPTGPVLLPPGHVAPSSKIFIDNHQVTLQLIQLRE